VPIEDFLKIRIGKNIKENKVNKKWDGMIIRLFGLKQ
jgi:hypothetical protein